MSGTSTVLLFVAVAAAGAIGAPARLLADQWVTDRSAGTFPLGTLLINVVGSFILGLVTGLATWQGLGNLPKEFLGTGFCGAFTTFSTFSYETVRLAEEGSLELAFRNVLASLVVGLVAAGAGLALAWIL